MSRANEKHGGPLTSARRRRLITGVVLGLLIVCPAARASAPPPVLAQRVVTPDFVVHYTTDGGTPDAISTDTARLVGDNAEKSLATEASAFGFDPRPIEADGTLTSTSTSSARQRRKGLRQPVSPAPIRARVTS